MEDGKLDNLKRFPGSGRDAFLRGAKPTTSCPFIAVGMPKTGAKPQRESTNLKQSTGGARDVRRFQDGR